MAALVKAADAKQAVGEGKDALRHVAETLRIHGPETRACVLGEQRIDIFRSKDLYKYLRSDKADQASLDVAIPPRENADVIAGKDLKSILLEDQIKRLGARMLHQNFIKRVDRVIKTRSKGRKHVKFPKRVEIHPENTFVEDGFYMWLIDRPRTIWSTIGSFGLVAVVMACCFFPMAPYKIKLGVLYTSLSLLGLIFAVAVVRVMVFVIFWICLGKYIWLLPNLFNEEIPIADILKPMHSVSIPPEGTSIKLLNRVIAALAYVATVVFLYQMSPDSEGLAKSAKSANQGILEMLNLQSPHAQLAGRVGNETEPVVKPRKMKTSADIAAEAAVAGMAAAAAAEAALKGDLRKEKRDIVHVDPFSEDFLKESEEGSGGAKGGANATGEAAAEGEAGEKAANASAGGFAEGGGAAGVDAAQGDTGDSGEKVGDAAGAAAAHSPGGDDPKAGASGSRGEEL